MEILEAYQPFEIQKVQLEHWKRRPVKNNFFELVWIKKGKGTQCINYNEYPYQAGSLFLLPPLQCHSFQLDTISEFVFLKFTADFFQPHRSDSVDHTPWFERAAYILSNYNQLPGDIIHSSLDRQHLYTLIDLILQESQQYGRGSTALIKSLMTAILHLLLRNIKQSTFPELAHQTGPTERITQLLGYINEHLGEPARLKVEPLAKTFLLSPSYLSEFFRKKVNLSLKTYITRARLKQVEIRLLNSNHTLSEIADELGFTDVSHLSKTFKRHTGLSPSAFKARGTYQLLKRSVC